MLHRVSCCEGFPSVPNRPKYRYSCKPRPAPAPSGPLRSLQDWVRTCRRDSRGALRESLRGRLLSTCIFKSSSCCHPAMQGNAQPLSQTLDPWLRVSSLPNLHTPSLRRVHPAKAVSAESGSVPGASGAHRRTPTPWDRSRTRAAKRGAREASGAWASLKANQQRVAKALLSGTSLYFFLTRHEHVLRMCSPRPP